MLGHRLDGGLRRRETDSRVSREVQLVVPPREMQQNSLTQIVGTAKVDVAMAIFDMLDKF